MRTIQVHLIRLVHLPAGFQAQVMDDMERAGLRRQPKDKMKVMGNLAHKSHYPEQASGAFKWPMAASNLSVTTDS